MGRWFLFTALLVHFFLDVSVSTATDTCFAGRSACTLSDQFCINEGDCCSGRCDKLHIGSTGLVVPFIGLCAPCLVDGNPCESNKNCCGGLCTGKSCTSRKMEKPSPSPSPAVLTSPQCPSVLTSTLVLCTYIDACNQTKRITGSMGEALIDSCLRTYCVGENCSLFPIGAASSKAPSTEPI